MKTVTLVSRGVEALRKWSRDSTAGDAEMLGKSLANQAEHDPVGDLLFPPLVHDHAEDFKWQVEEAGLRLVFDSAVKDVLRKLGRQGRNETV